MRIQIKNLLYATDFSEVSNKAISYGITLAREFQAKLHLCHVIELHSASLYGEVQLDLPDIQRSNIEFAHHQFQQLLADEAIAWEALVTIGSAADEITRLVRERSIDLVIATTHGRSGLKRLLLGSVTERLMRTLPCPLLVVRSTPEGQRPAFRMKQILVGCDFSADSNLALQHALSLAQEFQAELHLAHVLEQGPGGPADSTAARRDENRLEQLRRQVDSRLAALIPAEAANWCSPKTVVLMGKPFEELTLYATANAMDLIVLGIRGHSLIESLLVGSTTDRVVRQSPCPVLAVRPIPADYPEVEERPAKRRKVASPLELTRDFFSTEQRGETALLRLEKDLLFQMTNLSARDTFLDYLELVAGSSAIKVLVILGSSEKSGREEYCSFYNKIFQTQMEPNTLHRLLNVVDQIILRIVNFNKAVVHVDCGRVIPIFLNFSLACDYRIVAADTVYQNPCVDLGLIPKGGGAFFLPRILGFREAYEILLSREDLPASRALELKLVDEVVANSALEEAALKAARRFSDFPASSVFGIKRLLNFSHRELREFLELENQVLLNCVSSRER